MRIFLNNVAVITGGSSGIGKEVAKRLVAGGASVVIGGRDADKLAQAADEIDPSGERVRLFAGNLSTASTAQWLVDAHTPPPTPACTR